MFKHHFIKRSLAGGLVVAAAAFPVAAQARYIEDPGTQSASPVLTAGPATPATALGPTDASSGGYRLPVSPGASATAQPGSSFHWGDAGIGAGGAAVLLGMAGLGASVTRRRRHAAVS